MAGTSAHATRRSRRRLRVPLFSVAAQCVDAQCIESTTPCQVATAWCASDYPEEDPLKDAQGNLVLGRTRWRRFAAVMGPAIGAAALLVTGIANGALPASF